MKYDFQILFIILILTFLVVVSGCTQEKAISKNLTSDKFVLVEFINYKGVELGGSDNIESSLYDTKYWEGPWIIVDNDSKTYSLMGDLNGTPIVINYFNKTIQGVETINVSNELKAVLIYWYADITSSNKDEGCAAYGISKLPYYLADDVKILNVNDSGLTEIEYMGNDIKLKPGEEWSNVTYKANIMTNIKIKNHGIWNKSGINSR